AQYYPAQYWWAMMQLPPKSDFPGTGPSGNGISPTIKSQGDWVRKIVTTDACTACHQLGNKATREIPKALGTFEDSVAAWDRRIQSGPARASVGPRFTQWRRARRERGPARPRQRSDTRGRRGEHSVPAGRHPCAEQRNRSEAAGSRSE